MIFYILLVITPILLHFIGFKFLTFNYRGLKAPRVKTILFLSQLPLYLLLLLTLIGYSKVLLFSILGFYFVFNLSLQLYAHKLTKKYKKEFVEQCKMNFHHSIVK